MHCRQASGRRRPAGREATATLDTLSLCLVIFTSGLEEFGVRCLSEVDLSRLRLSFWMTTYSTNHLSYAAAAAACGAISKSQRHFMQEACHLSRSRVESGVCAAYILLHPRILLLLQICIHPPDLR